MTTRFTRSAFALSGIFALSLSMASPIAFAQEVDGEQPGPAAAAAPASVIDASKTGSITIHKFLFDNPTTPGTGEVAEPPAGATPLGGVKFKIEAVKLDQPLNTPTGFAAARKLTADTATVDTAPGKSWEVTTSGTGEAKQALPVGVYKVTELPVTDASSITGLAKDKQLTAAAPFLVFVPMTNAARTGWNYDVNVYPKNSETGATKEVSDAGKNVGDEVTYTITGDIPVPGKNGSITKFEVKDSLDPTKFAANPTVKVSGKDINAVLTQDTDYKTTVTGTDVKVEFTPSGLKILADAKNEAIKATGTKTNPQVVVEITAKVLPVEGNQPEVRNTGTVVSNNGSTETDTETPTNEVVTYFGKVRINKVDDENKKLDGAKFQVYTCSGTDEAPVLDSAPLKVNEKTEWVTVGGTVVIDGLHVTDFADNKEVPTPEKTYCLVETEAPVGYELLTKPVKFDLKRADLAADEGAEGEPILNVKALQVTNVKSTTPNLPLTGGPGIVALVLAGLTLIGGGAWYGLRSTRKA